MPVNNQKPIQLNMKKKDLFHHFISLQSNGFLSKHSRLDIQTAVEFFTTWVTKPDEDDYKKLAREILYLREMMNMTLNSSTSNTEMCNGG